MKTLSLKKLFVLPIIIAQVLSLLGTNHVSAKSLGVEESKTESGWSYRLDNTKTPVGQMSGPDALKSKEDEDDSNVGTVILIVGGVALVATLVTVLVASSFQMPHDPS